MRQQARDSARESAPRGSDRSTTNHNTLQARETAANQRLHDRMGRQQNAGIFRARSGMKGLHRGSTATIGWKRAQELYRANNDIRIPSFILPGPSQAIVF
jgi:hypothetical protein